MPWLSLLLFDDGCVALWALRHFAMIPVADATGRDLSPSGLAGFAGLIEHTSPTNRGTLGIPITAQPKALLNSISACALWLWMDSKFSDEHRNQTMRGSFLRVFARSRTESSTNLGLSQARSVTRFSSSLLMIEQIKRCQPNERCHTVLIFWESLFGLPHSRMVDSPWKLTEHHKKIKLKLPIP